MKTLRKRQEGSIFIEYALLIVLIVLVAVVALGSLGTTINDNFGNANTQLGGT